VSSLPAGILQRGEEFEARLGAGQEGLQAPPSPKLKGSSNSGENNQREKVSAEEDYTKTVSTPFYLGDNVEFYSTQLTKLSHHLSMYHILCTHELINRQLECILPAPTPPLLFSENPQACKTKPRKSLNPKPYFAQVKTNAGS
jgi:hypothetical protein